MRLALGEAAMKVADSFRMSTTKKSMSSMPSFLTSCFCASIRAAFLVNGAAGFVVSNTEIRSCLPPILKILVSIMMSSSGVMWSTWALASSIASANVCTSRPASAPSSAAWTLSNVVVVGDRNSRESDRIPESIRPAIAFGIFKPIALAREYRMLVAEQSARMSISNGSEFVRPLSLWWSTMEWIGALVMPSGSSAGLFVSTMATVALGSSAVSSGGSSTSRALSTNAVSGFSSPKR
mmetsp:Transcript_7772/g.19200  ORF Transcript_7772/g.19200 Transcript_7772/m.19200 type:complete len:237 (+) Transcript_7772:368-1078(+)